MEAETRDEDEEEEEEEEAKEQEAKERRTQERRRIPVGRRLWEQEEEQAKEELDRVPATVAPAVVVLATTELTASSRMQHATIVERWDISTLSADSQEEERRRRQEPQARLPS